MIGFIGSFMEGKGEVVKLTLPDWSSSINTQLNAFLGWSTVSGLVAAVIGVAVGAVVLSMFMKVFLKS